MSRDREHGSFGSETPDPEAQEVADFYRSTEAVRDPKRIRFESTSLGNRQLLVLVLVPVCLFCLVFAGTLVAFLITQDDARSQNIAATGFGLLGLIAFSILGALVLRKYRTGSLRRLGSWMLVPPLLVLLTDVNSGGSMLASLALASILALPALMVFLLSRPKGRPIAGIYVLAFVAYGVFASGLRAEPGRLYRAVQKGDPEVVRKLVENGASMTVTGPNGKTPLILAVDRKNYEIVEILLSGDGPLGKRDYRGRSALSIAVGEKDPKMIRLLVAAGAPVLTNIRSGGLRPLARAVKDRDSEMAVLLVEELRRKRFPAAEVGDG